MAERSLSHRRKACPSCSASSLLALDGWTAHDLRHCPFRCRDDRHHRRSLPLLSSPRLPLGQLSVDDAEHRQKQPSPRYTNEPPHLLPPDHAPDRPMQMPDLPADQAAEGERSMKITEHAACQMGAMGLGERSGTVRGKHSTRTEQCAWHLDHQSWWPPAAPSSPPSSATP